MPGGAAASSARPAGCPTNSARRPPPPRRSASSVSSKPDGGPPATTGCHLAWRAQNRAQVDAFYAAALAAGGKDNGAPGLRPDYHPNYYGAFVIDPEGNNVEAVCHLPE